MSMGKTKNHLINEKSPYLLQHVFNPVEWYPWGEDAFTKAEKEDKPIFISIGYSTCHWCHVMAHESFENPDIAILLNKWFVCIKVDREERPDIDRAYMAAVQAMNGSGGWPMSVFLFPDGRPFWGGTYIPPLGMLGQPGFSDILEAVNSSWQGRRDELNQSAQTLLKALQGDSRQVPAKIRDDINERAFSTLTGIFDSQYGGLGNAPKFPQPVALNFLFFYHHLQRPETVYSEIVLKPGQTQGNLQALQMALTTLQAMAAGGIYDHIGGGFHRYSVDNQWRVPHFEKMLYDQAQLLHSYLDAFQITGNQQYSRVADEISLYILRDMRASAGGFYSAEDADSEDPYESGKHSEGAFYLWTEEEIVKIIGAEAAGIFNFCYGVSFNGNALNDPHKDFTGRNILYLAQNKSIGAEHFKMEVEEIENSLRLSHALLFERRAQRTRPHLDDKVITSWNGLMIGALARAGVILEKEELVEAAEKAVEFIKNTLFCRESGELQRRYRDGEAGITGQLEDYSFLISGMLDLYHALHDPVLLEWATELMETAIKLFQDKEGGGFFDAVIDTRLPARIKNEYDGAEPSANSVMVMNLVRLARLTNNTGLLELASATIDVFADRINSYPLGLVQMLCGYLMLQTNPVYIVVAGSLDWEDTQAMLTVVHHHYSPGQILLLVDGGDNQKLLTGYLPFLQNISIQEDRAKAFIIRESIIQMEITDVDELKIQIEKNEETL